MTDNIEAMTPHVGEQELAEQLVEQARTDGVELIGTGGLLTGLTSKVINTALGGGRGAAGARRELRAADRAQAAAPAGPDR